MDDRIIKVRTRGNSVQLLNCLSSLFVSELLSPCPELYLISPWLSNVTLIDNRFGQYRALCRTMDKEMLKLADILLLLSQRDTNIRIITRPNHRPTRDFLAGLSNRKNIAWHFDEREHEKGLISAHFYVHGSMNFTYSGININGENVELSRDPEKVFTALQEARLSWVGTAHG